MHYDCVILGAGNYPLHPVPCALLDHKRVVCCDSAAEAYVLANREPWAVVGDGDSLKAELRTKLHIHIVPEQESNDQTKAVRYAKSKGAKHIAIIGATGKREDHTLGNISLLTEYLKEGVKAEMFTDHGVFLCGKGDRRICSEELWWLPLCGRESLAESEVSLFNISCKQIETEGLSYPTHAFTNWWQGTLNHTKQASFTIKADGEWIVFIAYSVKK